MENKKILIVDDELHMRIFMATLFETSGYEPILAKNGKEGIEKARQNKPALIILDVMMPEEGGIIMYRHIKTEEALRHIPVIMLSAVAGKAFSHSLEILNIGLDHALPEPQAYVEKPPKADILLDIAKKILIRTNEKETDHTVG
jgi:CheY-like chemotaxis protein